MNECRGGIILVTACGNKKEEKPMPAGKLYKSTRIRHLYRKSKELGIPFFILSAKYGLIEADTVISPYNEIMTDDNCKKFEDLIEEVINKYDTILYYKGGARKEYYKCLEKITKKLNKKFISFGYGNMGDIRKLEEIIRGI